MNLSKSSFALKPLLSVNGRKIYHLSDLAEAIDEAAIQGIAAAGSEAESAAATSAAARAGTGAGTRAGSSDEATQVDSSAAGGESSSRPSDASSGWVFFEFGGNMQAAFAASEANAATAEIADEYMLKSTRSIEIVDKA